MFRKLKYSVYKKNAVSKGEKDKWEIFATYIPDKWLVALH